MDTKIVKIKGDHPYHEIRRLAKMYSAVHDISYYDLLGEALSKYIDVEELRKDLIEWLKNAQSNFYIERNVENRVDKWIKNK
jgi:hypothetical protein